jgi:biopolymer transport protein ExbD
MTTAHSAEAAPIIEINMTPLIDVLLVLIVMLILTIPVQSHAVKIDVPPPAVKERINPIRNTVGITASGSLRWNGAVVGKAELSSLLTGAAAMPPEPETHLRPDAVAPYGIVDEVLVLARKARVKRIGFVGNEAYGSF